MKRPALIVMTGLILGLGAYFGCYFAGTASRRSLLQSESPELAWLKKEFNLGDAEFKRISELHAAYQPECAEMCRRIGAKNAEFRELLSKTNVLTPEIEARLAEAGQLRLECQKNMLRHFLEVSRSMPAEQGRRYLAWVQEKTFLMEHRMQSPDSESVTTHEHGPR